MSVLGVLAPALLVLGAGACHDDPSKESSSSSGSPSPTGSAAGKGTEDTKLGKILDAAANDAYALPQAIPTADDSANAPARHTDSYPTKDGVLKITPIHHATLMLQYANKVILVDPVHSEASYTGLPKADYVFYTHAHPDHVEAQGLDDVKKDGTVVVGPASVAGAVKLSFTLNDHDKHDFGAFSVETVPMYNLQRGPAPGQLYHPKGQGNGYVFVVGQSDGGISVAAGIDGGPFISRVYVSGDTECTPEMKALKDIDIAFVCTNLPYTMPPEEAAACVREFKPRIVYPYHDRGSNLDAFSASNKPTNGTEVVIRNWYAK